MEKKRPEADSASGEMKMKMDDEKEKIDPDDGTTTKNGGSSSGSNSNKIGSGNRKKTFRLSRLQSLSVQRDLSEIFDFLYLGAKAASVDAITLETLGITHIVNCTDDLINHFEKDGVKYLGVPVKDDPSGDIYLHFEPTSFFIEEARLNNGKVFVHCNVGMSRSSTIVVAYLMKCKRMNLIDALRYTKLRRPMSSPNSGFMRQLLELEMELYGKETVDLERYRQDRFQEVSAFSKA